MKQVESYNSVSQRFAGDSLSLSVIYFCSDSVHTDLRKSGDVEVVVAKTATAEQIDAAILAAVKAKEGIA